jgi:hypothetical protein
MRKTLLSTALRRAVRALWALIGPESPARNDFRELTPEDLDRVRGW